MFRELDKVIVSVVFLDNWEEFGVKVYNGEWLKCCLVNCIYVSIDLFYILCLFVL